MDDKRRDGSKGQHIKNNVEKAAMEPVGGNQGPPGLKMVNGNSARSPQEIEYIHGRGQCKKRVDAHDHIPAAVYQTDGEHENIGVNDAF